MLSRDIGFLVFILYPVSYPVLVFRMICFRPARADSNFKAEASEPEQPITIPLIVNDFFYFDCIWHIRIESIETRP